MLYVERQVIVSKIQVTAESILSGNCGENENEVKGRTAARPEHENEEMTVGGVNEASRCPA